MTARVHAKVVAAVWMLVLSACVYAPENPGAAPPGATFSASVNNLRPGQVTVLTVQLTRANDDIGAIDVANTNVVLRDGNSVFASGVTDANGQYVGAWSFTGSVQAGSIVSTKLSADIQLNSTEATLTLDENISVSVFSPTPGFAITKVFANDPTGSAIMAGGAATFVIAAQDANPNTTGTAGYTTETSYVGVITLAATNSPNTVLPARVTFTAADKGAVTVSNITFTHAGNVTFSAQDVSSTAVNGYTTFTVNPNVAATLQVTLNSSSPNTVTANEGATLTVVGVDSFGNPTTYPGTITVTATSDNGSGTPQITTGSRCDVNGCPISVGIGNNGTYTITVTGTTPDGTPTPGNQIGVTAVAPTIDHFVVNQSSGNGNAVIGTPLALTVAAVDLAGHAINGYTGTITFTSTDPSAAFSPASWTYPADANGVAYFPQGVTFNTWPGSFQNQNIIVTSDSGKTGIRSILVGPDKPFYTITKAPSTVAELAPVNVTVSLTNTNGTPMAFADTMTFAVNGVTGNGVVYTAPAGTLGTANVSPAATFTSSGTATLTVSDATNRNAIYPATSSAITVTDFTGPYRMQVFNNTAPATVSAGSAFTFTVAIVDNNNNLYPYSGTIGFSSDDPNGSPSSVTSQLVPVSSSQMGLFTLTATLATPGHHTLTVSASDITNPTLSVSVIANVGSADHMQLAPFPSSVKAGTPQSTTLTVYDAANNVVTGFTGTVTFTVPSNATGPATYAMNATDNGSHTFTTAFTFRTAQNNASVKVQNAGVLTPTYTTPNFIVTPADANSFTVVLANGSPQVAGTNDSVTVQAFDAYNNAATGYTGTVSFSTNNPNAILPLPRSFASGTIVANVTFQRAINSNITVTDGIISAGSSFVTVVPSSLASFTASPATQIVSAGNNAIFTISGFDTYKNLTTNYLGTVTFSASDPAATYPGANPYTFTAANAGSYTFTITPRTAGNQTASITDTSAGVSLTVNLVVNAGPAAKLVFNPNVNTSLAACSAQTFTVNALDAYNNLATTTSGSVSFTVNGSPQVSTLNGGAASTVGIYRSLGTSTIAASSTFATANATFTAYQPTPSIAINATAQQGNTSCVNVTYTVTNACNANIVATQFTANANTPLPATVQHTFGTGTTGLTNLNFSPNNTQTFLWDAGRDLPHLDGTATLKLTIDGTTTSAQQNVVSNTGANIRPIVTLFGQAGITSVARGDVNHNRLSDVAFGFQGNMAVALDGNFGNLATAVAAVTNDSITALAAGTFTHDGNSQIIACVHNAVQNSNRLRSYTYGNGGLVGSDVLVNVDCHAPMKAIDADRDGNLDLVTADGAGNLFFLHNTSSGSAVSFNANTHFNYGTNLIPNSIVVADFDLNGAPDLLLAPPIGTSAYLLYNTGTGGVFTAPVTVTNAAANPNFFIDVADFNRDGRVDLLGVTVSGTATVIYGTPTSMSTSPYNTIVIPFSVYSSATTIADVDGDGHPDIVSDSPGGTVGVNLWSTTGAFNSTIPVAVSSIGGIPVSLVSGAFAAPGQTDLLAFTTVGAQFFSNSPLQRCASYPVGSITAPDWISAPRTAIVTNGSGSLATYYTIGDFDADGRPDFISIAPKVMYFTGNEGTGMPNGTLNPNTFAGNNPMTPPVVVDLDNDGTGDTVYAFSSTSTSTVTIKSFRNPNSSTVPTTLATFSTTAQVLQVLPILTQQPNQPYPDLLVTTNDNKLTVFTNISSPGNISFASTPVTTVAPTAFTKAVVTPPGHDFNSDNSADVVLGGGTSALVNAFGSTARTFTFGTNSAIGGTATDIAVAPFSNAASPNSVMMTAFSSGQVAMWKASALGPVQIQTFTLPSCAPLSLSTATLPNGTNAIATLCDNVQRVVVTPLTADGTATGIGYDIPVPFTPGNANSKVMFTDVNSDSAPDVIVFGNPNGPTSFVTTALYNSRLAPTYWQGADNTNRIVTTSNPNYLSLFDVDHDGFLDAVTEQGSFAKVFYGNGNDTWDTNTASLPNALNGAAAIYADFAQNNNGVLAYLNAGSVTIASQTATNLSVPAGTTSLYAVDLNGDSWVDLVGFAPNQSFVYWLNNRSSTQPFSASSITGFSNGTYTGLAFGDFLHTGVNNVATTTSSGGGYIFQATTATTTQVGSFPIGGVGAPLLAADIDQDGWTDLVAVNGGYIVYYLRNQAGAFSIGTSAALTANVGTGAAIGDVNHDGYPDVVLPLISSSSVPPAQVVLFTSPTMLSTSTVPSSGLYLLGSTPNGIVSADVNNDGLPDLTATQTGAGGLTRTIWTAVGE